MVVAAALLVSTSIIWGMLPGAIQAAPADIPARFGMDLGPGLDAGRAATNGLQWIRTTADWSQIEPSRGQFSWNDMDAAVVDATKAKASLVVLVANTPQWAAVEPTAPESVWKHQPPSNVADWQRFIDAAATRYRGRVAAWEIEPTLEFQQFRGTVHDYLDMLHAARLAVRKADPNALVVAASPAGFDLSYIKWMFGQAADDFDALMLNSRRQSPEDVLEAVTTIHTQIAAGSPRQLWLTDSDDDLPKVVPDAEVGDRMARMAAVDVAGQVTRQFWTGREASDSYAAVRRTILRSLDGTRFGGWLERGPWVFAFVMTGSHGPIAVLWTTGAPRAVSVPTDTELTIVAKDGTPVAASIAADGTPNVPLTESPVFVHGVSASEVAAAAQMAARGPVRIPRDPAHDYSRADMVTVDLSATNTEHGLYNQRFRSLPSGAVVPVTIDGADAVKTDPQKDAVYIYLDVDHSYAYFIDGRRAVLITVLVHRAAAPEQVGFNILYDSITGYRFTPWQWVDAGTGWVSYTIRLIDAEFSSSWGWDLPINAAGDKKEPLGVRSVAVKLAPKDGSGMQP